MNNRGFSLIELLIVVSIIGILGAVAVTGYIGTVRKAARSEAYANLHNLRLLEEQNFAENAVYVAGAGTGALMGALPRFQPGTPAALSYNYVVVLTVGQGLPAAPAVPYDGAQNPLANPNTPCFIATATAIVPRVAGDIFAIDCNNVRNF